MITRKKKAGKLIGVLSAVLVVGVGFIGCDKKDEGDKKDSVTWPEKPADGAPVAMVFLEMKGEGEDMHASVRFFNFSDKGIKRISMTLDYLGEGDKKLKDFPWSQMFPRNLEAKGHFKSNVGAFLPEGTKKVNARMREVEFEDGTKWTAEE